jgi:hypothetical protein
MDDDEATVRHDEAGLVLQWQREAPDEVEAALAAGCDVRAVLDVAGRPEPLGGRVVAPVEQRIEGLKHQCFILLLYRLTHSFGPPSTGMLAPGNREQLPPNENVQRHRRRMRADFTARQ